MKIAFLLHLYQPATQEESLFRRVFTQSYQPLIKLIKNKKNVGFTLNVPLSLLEQMDRYGYKDWIADVKDLYHSERVELVGSAAYHPLLTKISENSAEQQIILNEYSLGYYFGSHQGFEGEPSLMLKNVNGFFAPECAVNESVANLVGQLGYSWMLVDEPALGEGVTPETYYRAGSGSLKFVPRNTAISNLLSFKRDTGVSDVVSALKRYGSDVVVALDGEMFGHHFSEGMLLLEELMSAFNREDIKLVTVSELLNTFDEKKIPGLKESTWGADENDTKNGNIYPFWFCKGNKSQELLYKLDQKIAEAFSRNFRLLDIQDYDTVPFWITSGTNDVLNSYLSALLPFLKSQQSDKYWWASNKLTFLGSVLSHKGMILASLAFVEEFSMLLRDLDSAAADEIDLLVTKIKDNL